jgi:hypothetical protein
MPEEAESKARPVIKVEEIKETKEKPTEKSKPDIKSNLKFLILSFLVGFILGGVLVGGVFYWKNSVAEGSKQESTPKPTPVVISTPTPEPEEIDLSKYSVQVLNGSGITGAAAAVQGLLKEQGFENIEIGNATSSGFTNTEVRLKKDVPNEVYEQIKKSLSDYSVIKDSLLAKDDSYDIIITVGKRE